MRNHRSPKPSAPRTPRLDQSTRQGGGAKNTTAAKGPVHPDEVRLNKFLADCGVTSRRGADELIREGAVSINGKKVYELGARVNVKSDRVMVNGKPVQVDFRKVYIAFHKPKGVLTTMEDPEGRPCIADYFKHMDVRIFPIGRLDWDSEGLILLTNDGEFAQRVMHPKHEVLKTYHVKVNGHPSEDQLQKLRRGVSIKDGGKVAARHLEKIKMGDSDLYDWLRISVGEGKNRQVRKMFEKIGFDVLKLQRVAIGRLKLSGLPRGEWAMLAPDEVERIFAPPIEEGGARRARVKSVKSRARDESSQRQQKSARDRARGSAGPSAPAGRRGGRPASAGRRGAGSRRGPRP
jgi:23S rRNA pseudouridine2605 synthase